MQIKFGLDAVLLTKSNHVIRRFQYYYATNSFFLCISCHLLSAILLLKRTDRLDGKSGNVVPTVDVSHRLGSENERDCIVNLIEFYSGQFSSLINVFSLMTDGLIKENSSLIYQHSPKLV
jgi:hypothetical protein